MSIFTTEVRYICEEAAGYNESVGYLGVDEVLNRSWSKVIDFDFPLWDPNYKEALCKKILLHFYTREIGFETVGLWKLKLKTRLNEIMPYYNELYKTTVLKFNPLYDVDYTKTHSGNAREKKVGTGGYDKDRDTDRTLDRTEKETLEEEGHVNSEGTTTVTDSGENTRTDNLNESTQGTKTRTANTTHWDVYSDTPQGALDNVANETYLTNARKITETGPVTESDLGSTRANTGTVQTMHDNEGSSNTEREDTSTRNGERNNIVKDTEKYEENETVKTTDNHTIDNTDEYIDHVIGKTGGASYMKRVKEMRDNIINIDLMIINALNDLFFMLWEV